MIWILTRSFDYVFLLLVMSVNVVTVNSFGERLFYGLKIHISHEGLACFGVRFPCDSSIPQVVGGGVDMGPLNPAMIYRTWDYGLGQ